MVSGSVVQQVALTKAVSEHVRLLRHLNLLNDNMIAYLSPLGQKEKPRLSGAKIIHSYSFSA